MLIEREKWNLIARSFDETRDRPWKICLDFIEKISKVSVVIDIGCGNGRHLIEASKKCRFAIGLDFSIEMLRLVKDKIENSKIKNVDLILGDARHLPIKDNSIDFALFIASLHNVKGREERIKSLREVRRVLKKDGRAMITSWYRWQRRFRFYFLKDFFIRKEKEFGDIHVMWKRDNLNIPRFYHLYSKRELARDIRKAGLRMEELRKVRISEKKGFDNVIAIVKKY